MATEAEIIRGLRRAECEADYLYFVRYFFFMRERIKFRVNWHHHLLADTVRGVIEGKYKNVVINVSPGSSKTEMVVINFIAYGLALNPRARFLHISFSDDLVALNSSVAKGIVQSDEYQELWQRPAKDDSDAKKRWNVMDEEGAAGGVYAVSLGGTITGFRAGHMTEGFTGAILIDDPLKPVDAYSPVKRKAANDALLHTIKSRKAQPDTPTIVIMQRLAEEDPTGFILAGKAGATDWHHVVIPALLTDAYVSTLDPKYQKLIAADDLGAVRDDKGRFSYWPYKEPLADLLLMEAASEYVFTGQYGQRPSPLGGGIFKVEWFPHYAQVPALRYRTIYADTASKTAERNDFTVFQCVGLGVDGRVYVLDQLRGKWEAWQLEEVAIAFWELHNGLKYADGSSLRRFKVEDKSSGTGLIQNIKKKGGIPIEGIPREKDKLTRAMDVQSFYKTGLVMLPPIDTPPMLTKYKRADGTYCILSDKPWVPGYLQEHAAFTPDDTHQYDDQIDPTLDAVNDMLGSGNTLSTWSRLSGAAA